MKQLTLTTMLLHLSIGVATSTNASVSLTDAGTLFNNEAHGFEGKVKLTCQAKGIEVANTISEIVAAASAENTMTLLISSFRFAFIGPPFINECGSYMKDNEKEVLTALVNFASSFIEEDTDY